MKKELNVLIYYNFANPNDLMNLDNDYYGCYNHKKA